jgi:hypothetical protein
MVSNGLTYELKFENTKSKDTKAEKNLLIDFKFHLSLFIFLTQLQNPQPIL